MPGCVASQPGFSVRAENNPVTLDVTATTRSFAQTVVIHNANARPLYVDLCGLSLERKEGSKWRNVRVTLCAINGIAHVVAPHDSATIPLPFHEETGQVVLLGPQARFIPGVYRVVFTAGRKIGGSPEGILDPLPAPSSEFLVIEAQYERSRTAPRSWRHTRVRRARTAAIGRFADGRRAHQPERSGR